MLSMIWGGACKRLNAFPKLGGQDFWFADVIGLVWIDFVFVVWRQSIWYSSHLSLATCCYPWWTSEWTMCSLAIKSKTTNANAKYFDLIIYCHLVCQVPPPDALGLVRLTLNNVQKYFHGITGRRWIPKQEALTLVQSCHEIVEPWPTEIEALHFIFNNASFSQHILIYICYLAYPRKHIRLSTIGPTLAPGSYSRRFQKCISSKRLGCLVVLTLELIDAVSALNNPFRLWMMDQIERGAVLVMSPIGFLSESCTCSFTISYVFFLLGLIVAEFLLRGWMKTTLAEFLGWIDFWTWMCLDEP